VVDADRIYVLERGQVVQSGSHAELMAAGGLYASLYRHNLEEAR
jgi:ATP-binding cassette subfamily B protein